jgi:hypothetical protein
LTKKTAPAGPLGSSFDAARPRSPGRSFAHPVITILLADRPVPRPSANRWSLRRLQPAVTIHFPIVILQLISNVDSESRTIQDPAFLPGAIVTTIRAAALPVFLGLLTSLARGGDAAAPLGEPTLEPATMHSLGVHWAVRGDDNRNARVGFSYRSEGGREWRSAPDLFRVEKGLHKDDKGQSSVVVPDDGWLFAGSALRLDPGTSYELKLSLADPDGGSTEHVLKQATITEPVAPAGLRAVHVAPGAGGGSGAAADPFKGLTAAIQAATPGTLILLHKGTYDGPIVITKSGEPGRPIILRGAGDGEAVIDGKTPPQKGTGTIIDITGMHDIWFENLTIVNGYNAIKAAGCQRIVVRRCDLHDIMVGFFCSLNVPHVATGMFISDNTITGPMPFPIPAEAWHKFEAIGVWLTGQGHVVCYNRISHFEDAMRTFGGIPCAAMDFHNNDCSELVDDGAEFDFSERNIRNFDNRYTNALVALSFQPIFGGPAYAFGNACYNFRGEPVKLHVAGKFPQTSGAVMVHNTFVHMGNPWPMGSSEPVINCYSRDNLFVGTEGPAVSFGTKVLERCDFDYDGFGGWSGDRFMKFIDSYSTPEEVKAKGRIERHLTIVDPKTLFASGLQPPTQNPAYDPEKDKGYVGTTILNTYPVEIVDLRLKSGSAAIGAGEVLPGFGDDPKAPPYLGAIAPGAPLPHYGPRPQTVVR